MVPVGAGECLVHDVEKRVGDGRSDRDVGREGDPGAVVPRDVHGGLLSGVQVDETGPGILAAKLATSPDGALLHLRRRTSRTANVTSSACRKTESMEGTKWSTVTRCRRMTSAKYRGSL